MGRHFSRDQANEIRALLRALRRAERGRQKTLRAKLRRIGFRISDYDASGEGFTVSDFDQLVQAGVVTLDEQGPNSPRKITPASGGAPSSPPEEISASSAASGSAREALARQRHHLDVSDPEIADSPGLYAIHSSPAVWRELTLGHPPDGRPLYVGKAEDSLVARDLRSHFGEPKRGRQSITGRSTVRRTFAALLVESLDLSAQPRNPSKPDRFANYGLSFEDDEKLTAWMRTRLALAVWPATGRQSLADLELEILRAWEPPLNLAGVTTPWSSTVSAARARMADQARAWPPGS